MRKEVLVTIPLPDAPNWEHLKNQAKDLRKAHQARDTQAALRLQRHLPRLAGISSSAVFDGALSLSEAQFVIAREYGFSSWPRLKAHLDSLAPDSIEAFKEAVEAGDAGRVRSLLRRHPRLRQQINAPLFSFDAPAVCLAKNNRALMDVLLRNGADINARSQWWAGGFGVLDGADADAAEYLIARGARVDAHAAADLGLLERLRELVEAQPELVHARGGDGQTPLHVARTPEVAGFLLDSGAEIEARDIDHGSTPAQYAVVERPGVCRYLLSRGAQDDLFMRCALGDIEAVRAFLAADPALLHATIDTGRHDPDPAPGLHIYHYLFANGATPLMAAAQGSQRAVVELLLTLGADVNAQNGGATALHHAAWSGYVEMLQFLLSRGADRNRRDTLYSSTAAGWAAHNGQDAAKEFLLQEAGIVDAAAFGLIDRTRTLLHAVPPPAAEDVEAALTIAAGKGQEEIVALLRRHREG